jgi:hypothetical protein
MKDIGRSVHQRCLIFYLFCSLQLWLFIINLTTYIALISTGWKIANKHNLKIVSGFNRQLGIISLHRRKEENQSEGVPYIPRSEKTT